MRKHLEVLIPEVQLSGLSMRSSGIKLGLGHCTAGDGKAQWGPEGDRVAPDNSYSSLWPFLPHRVHLKVTRGASTKDWVIFLP